MNVIPPWLMFVHKHTYMNAHTERTQNVKKGIGPNNMRQHIIERQQYWDCHVMKCLYNVLFNQIANKYNFSDTTLQLTWSKHSIHNYYNMFLSCRFLGNNIAIIMTFKIHRTCCLTEIYLKIDRENNLLWNILMCIWGQWWYTSMWYWLTLARMEMFSRTYLKRTWWSYWDYIRARMIWE